MKIIDSHFHIYKNERAGMLAQGQKSRFGFKATLTEALPILDRGIITNLVGIAVIPINPMRQAAKNKWEENITLKEKSRLEAELEETLFTRLHNYNQWLLDNARKDGRIEPAILADATVDPERMAEEIYTAIDHFDLKIIKIHPSVNSVFPDNPGYQRIFDIAEKKNLTVISHGGPSMDDPKGIYSAPKLFSAILEAFPKLKLVIAHLAYPFTADLFKLMSEHSNLFTDLSFVLSAPRISDETICDFIRSIGAKRVLFGSDFPWGSPENDVKRFLGFPLKDEEIEDIAYKNAERIFSLQR